MYFTNKVILYIIFSFTIICIIGCPDPNMFIEFEKGKKHVKILKYKFDKKYKPIIISGLGYSSTIYANNYRIFLTIRLDEPKLKNRIMFEPENIQIIFNNRKMKRIENDIPIEKFEYDLGNIYYTAGFESILLEENEKLEDIDNRIKLIIDSCFIVVGNYILIDTIYVKEKKLSQKYLKRNNYID